MTQRGERLKGETLTSLKAICSTDILMGSGSGICVYVCTHIQVIDMWFMALGAPLVWADTRSHYSGPRIHPDRPGA